MNHLYKLSFKAILSTLPIWATTVYAQTPTISYATWKDNAKAAYTIVHDDFGDASAVGIAQHADMIAYNRGIKFCFGAITSACDATDWANARRMMTHGHEIINHSHSHKCSHQPGWCKPNNLYSPSHFPVELDGSTTLIEQNTGYRPRFWIHPYDLSTPQVLERLKSLGYLGARSGTQAALNTPNFNAYFNLNYYVHDEKSNLSMLNQAVQTAVASGSYLMRELHGVSDGSWAPVSVSDYTAHLDFVKNHMNAGNIWSATASEVITYKIQKDSYYPSVAYDGNAKTLTVSFGGSAPIQTSLFKTPVTLNIKLNGLAVGNNLVVKQGGETLSAQVSATQITVNAYPYKGTIVISAPNVVSCEPNCPPPPPVCNADGKFKVEVWRGLTISTRSMLDLTNNTRYPDAPNTSATIHSNAFSRSDIGADQYGERLTGYLKPSVTGNYIFAISGDDDVELYFSTTNSAANKTKIAGFKGSTSSQQWTKYSGQKSQVIALNANQTYYIELLHLAVNGTNHCTLAWQTVGSQSFTPIPKTDFSSQPCAVSPTSQPLFTLNGTRTGQAALLNWSTNQVDENTPYTIERLEGNGRFSAIGTAENIQFADETPINGINIYRIRYTDTYGQTRHSEPVKLDFTENPKVYLAPNPARNEVSIDLREWNQAAVTVYVYDVRGAEVQRVRMTAGDTPYTLDLNSIQTGQYRIRVQSADGRAAAQRLIITKE
jgi:PA14 domain/Polysaccharide deacetylase/Secretion system C-terminal sorting domain